MTYCHGSKSRTSYPCPLPTAGLCTLHAGSPGPQESLSAWKLIGPEVKYLNGALPRDPKRKTRMFIMSLQQYNTERTEQHTKLRDKRSRDSPQTSGGNRWESAYVSAVTLGTRLKPNVVPD